ncbi:MAG: GerMN domain-containing protein [Fusobacteriota bacterium]
MKNFKVLLILLLITLATGYLYYINIITAPEYKTVDLDSHDTDIIVEDVESEIVNIYVPDKRKKNLKKQEIEISDYEDLNQKVKLIFNKLIEKNNLIRNNTRVINVFIDDEKLYLNVNDVLKEGINNSTEELLVIYSIVNTITDLNGITQVKILIENKEVETLGGYINLSDFFKKDNLLLKGD